MNKFVLNLVLASFLLYFLVPNSIAQEVMGTKMYISSEVVTKANFHIYDPPLELHQRCQIIGVRLDSLEQYTEKVN